MRLPSSTDGVNPNGKRTATKDMDVPPEVRARRSASSDAHGSVPSVTYIGAVANDVYGTVPSGTRTGTAFGAARNGLNSMRAAPGDLVCTQAQAIWCARRCRNWKLYATNGPLVDSLDVNETPD